MEEMEVFYKTIPNVENRPISELITYLAYYCSLKSDYFNISDINNCFDMLGIKRYSNVSSYLSSKTKGKTALFIKDKNGYKLNRDCKTKISNELNINIEIPITTEFFDIGILNNTRTNTQNIAKEMCQCYQIGAYTACCVMMRRLVETYIIECFESHQCEYEIKDTASGDFLFLSELIPKYLASNKWSKSKNIKSHLQEIKKLGDQCAHNRYFTGRKSDLDNIKSALRQTMEEIVHIIDYPSWNTRKKNQVYK